MIAVATRAKTRPRWVVSPASTGICAPKSVRRGSHASLGNGLVCWKPPSLQGPNTQNCSHASAM